MVSTESSARYEQERSVDALETIIRRFGDRAERRLKRLVSVLGSYLQAYLRAIGSFGSRAARLAFVAWLWLLMPYFAWASLGEFFLTHSIFWPGIAATFGLLLILGPLAALIVAVILIKRSHTPPTAEETEKVVRLFPRLSRLDRNSLKVPVSLAGYRFWMTLVVGGATAIVLASEVGWYFGVPGLVALHDTHLAWPNVAILDVFVGFIEMVIGEMVAAMAQIV